MIELKQNKIWTDSLSNALGLSNPWDELEKPLRKFICFAGGGGGPGGDGDGDGYGLSDADLDAMSITYAPADVVSPDFGGEFSGFGDYGVMDGFANVTYAGSNSPYTGEDQGAAYRNTSLPPDVLEAIRQDNLKPNQYGVPNAEWMGLTYNSNIAVPVEPGMPPPTAPYLSFSFPEFVMDLAEMALPFLSGIPIGNAIRGGLSSIDPSNTLGMNTMSLAEEIGSTLGLVSSDIGSTFLGSPAARGIDAVAAAINPSLGSISVNVPGDVTTPSTVFSSVISGNNPFSFSNSPNTTTAFSNNPTFNNETNSILEPRPLNGLASLSETDILPNIGSTSVSSDVINQPTSSISQSIRPPNRPLTVEEALRIARQGGGFNTRQGGGLVSLEAGGQPAKGTPPEGYRFNEEDYRNQFTAYQEWLAQHGGGEGLDKDAIKRGRIDTVYLPGAGEYEYFSFDGNNRAGAGLYDDDGSDLYTIPWAYPESPDFNKAWNAGNQGRNIFNNPYRRPSRSQTTEQFLATRLPVQAVRDQREVNDTSQTFTGLNSLATQGGLSNLFRPTDETIEEEDLTIDTSFAQSGGNIGGLVSLEEGGQPNPTYQAYQKWLKSIGGAGNLDTSGGRIDSSKEQWGERSYFANPNPVGDGSANLYSGFAYEHPWAYPEHPDFKSTIGRVLSGSDIMFDPNTGRAIPQQQQVLLSSTDQFLNNRDTINSIRDQRELTNRPLQSVGLSSLATRGGPSNFFRPTDETIEEEDLTIDTSFAQSGGNIGGLMNTGPNVIDVINKGMAMPENIGAVQMQEKIDINQSTPYTGR